MCIASWGLLSVWQSKSEFICVTYFWFKGLVSEIMSYSGSDMSVDVVVSRNTNPWLMYGDYGCWIPVS